jgi:hypothetical protein
LALKTSENQRRNNKKYHDKMKLVPEWVEVKRQKGREYYWANKKWKMEELKRLSLLQ